MSGAGIDSPVVLREALDRSLAGIVESLDPRHYPSSMLVLLERVLLPEKSLRGLPLLTMSVASGVMESDDCRLVAQEMLLRGWFLQAELIDSHGSKPDNGLAAELRERFTPAQVLLAADTLFTLPFELLAGPSEKEPAVLGRFSLFFGPEGALGELDRAEGGNYKAFLSVDPVRWLMTAALGEHILRDRRVEVLSRYVWLREAELWFGGSTVISAELECLAALLKSLVAEDSADPPGTRLGELYAYLGIC